MSSMKTTENNYPLMAPFVGDIDDTVLPTEEAFPIVQVAVASIILAALGIVCWFTSRNAIVKKNCLVKKPLQKPLLA